MTDIRTFHQEGPIFEENKIAKYGINETTKSHAITSLHSDGEQRRDSFLLDSGTSHGLSPSTSDLSLGNEIKLLPFTPPTTVCSEEHSEKDPWRESPGTLDIAALLTPRDITVPEQNDYLSFIEPGLVPPPSYNTLPPGGCPRFPVYSNNINADQEELPEYSPSIYKLDMVLRKTEWLSPFEPCPSRSWSFVIMELNSTQLNFYAVPKSIEHEMTVLRSHMLLSDVPVSGISDKDRSVLGSTLTLNWDLRFHRYCMDLGLIKNDKKEDQFLGSLSSPFLVSRFKSKEKKLVRSYSLQHAKIGLAIDYKKRANVLRLRVESEQILVQFPTTESLIQWNMALDTAKDISLDIEVRNLPKDRTLPRRRRRRRGACSSCSRCTNRGFHRRRRRDNPVRLNVSEFAVVRGKNPENKTNEKSAIKDTVLKLSSIFTQRKAAKVPQRATLGDGKVTITTAGTESSSAPSQYSIETEVSDYYVQESSIINCYNTFLDDHDEAGGDSVNAFEGSAEEMEENPAPDVDDIDDDDDDIQNISDINGSDDEEEEEDPEYDTCLSGDVLQNRQERSYSYPTSAFSLDEQKWNPKYDIAANKKKYQKNCLRCIKPLTFNENWVNSSLVKPTVISPLHLYYLQTVKYGKSPKGLSNFMNIETIIPGLVGKAASRRRLPIKYDFLPMTDTSLVKVTNHFLKEFTVGTHGLVPKEF